MSSIAKKIRIKKIYKIIFLSLILIILISRYNHNYNIAYVIDSVKIKEVYNKKDNIHLVKAIKNNQEYSFIVSSKKKKIVKKVVFYNKNNITCLNIIGNKIGTTPVCYQDSKLIDIHLLNNSDVNNYFNIKYKEANNPKSIYNIKVYGYNNLNFLLWNYKDFIFLNKNVHKKIKTINKDVYNLKIIERINNLLLLADYNQEYSFNHFIIINMDDGKKYTWKIDYEISMDSYILGKYKNSIFLVDKKNKVEYELVPHYKKIRIVGNKNRDGIIYDNGFKNISISRLINNELSFKKTQAYNYIVNDGKLYLSLFNSKKNTLISNNDNIKIVDQIDDSVYYLSQDKLYTYNLKDGEMLLMEYFEWNFNNDKMAFINK